MTTPQRSAIMRSVRSRDTGPEMALRRVLWRAGLRYRLKLRPARTRPDLAFPGARVAVFVDGCFWHGCPAHYGLPKSNQAFWREKVRRNQERDARDTLRLQAAGWTVVRIWACEIKRNPDGAVARIRRALQEPTAPALA